jgi:prepilin signal peptidase PulO-like enzyme (type II secretory pathway)
MIDTPSLFVSIPLIALLAALAIIELRSSLLPNLLTYPGTIYFLLLHAFSGVHPFYNYLASALGLIACLVMLERISGRFMMGMGAIKAFSMTGAALGFPDILRSIILWGICGYGLSLVNRHLARRGLSTLWSVENFGGDVPAALPLFAAICVQILFLGTLKRLLPDL